MVKLINFYSLIKKTLNKDNTHEIYNRSKVDKDSYSISPKPIITMTLQTYINVCFFLA